MLGLRSHGSAAANRKSTTKTLFGLRDSMVGAACKLTHDTRSCKGALPSMSEAQHQGSTLKDHVV
eukprot:365596-Chlamydomonas_euryale.AAC.4